MKIQVLGSGCPTCKKLHDIAQKAVDEMGLKTKVDYITGNEGMKRIVELGAMTSPLLVVNGKIAMTGFIPSIDNFKDKIRVHIK
jgi:small redox-active disulfide protein 2